VVGTERSFSNRRQFFRGPLLVVIVVTSALRDRTPSSWAGAFLTSRAILVLMKLLHCAFLICVLSTSPSCSSRPETPEAKTLSAIAPKVYFLCDFATNFHASPESVSSWKALQDPALDTNNLIRLLKSPDPRIRSLAIFALTNSWRNMAQEFWILTRWPLHLRTQEIQVFILSSSFGLSGWILAREIVFVLVYLVPEHLHRRDFNRAFSAWLHDPTPQNEAALRSEERRNDLIKFGDTGIIALVFMTLGAGIYGAGRFIRHKIGTRRSNGSSESPLAR
jgi:hypothetical protein